jgi:two-component system chemotaxis response regulator CheB
VVIGASAGALEALMTILPALPESFVPPVMIVVHLPPDQNSIMAELFRPKCRLKVQEALDKQPIEKGTVYFAPPDYHLLVEKAMCLSLSGEEPVLFSRPSIDVLFETAADAFGDGLTGVILTGANEDGAQGLRAVAQAGGAALVQDPGRAYASAMPEAALRACPQAQAMSLNEIAHFLREAGI